MTDQTTSLEKRVAALEQEVHDLKRSLTDLMASSSVDQPKLRRKQAERPTKAKEGASEEILSWVDKAYILPRVATTSFILVIALALRTATDNGVIDQQIGSFLGIFYAFGLIVYGWFAYRES